MEAAHAVRAARRRTGLSQRGFAARAGVSARTVAAIESGQATPSWVTVSTLVAAAGLEPVVDRVLPEPCSHLTRYLRYSTSERLYLSLGGSYQPQRDQRLAAWRELGLLARSQPLVLLEGVAALGVWIPGLRLQAPVAVSVPLVADIPTGTFSALLIGPSTGSATGSVPVAVPYGEVLVPPPEVLALDPTCAQQRVALRAAARLLHEQSGRDEAARRGAVHRDPDEARERDRLAARSGHGKGPADWPSGMRSRAWRLEGPVSLRQWMWDHDYPGVE